MSINVPHELNQADERILDALEKGVRNPSWLAEELDYSRQYVHQRLQLLVAAELVENLGHGLYQLEDSHADVEFIYEDDGRVTARHVESSVASFGENEAEALRQLADALDSHFGRGEDIEDPDEYLEGLEDGME